MHKCFTWKKNYQLRNPLKILGSFKDENICGILKKGIDRNRFDKKCLLINIALRLQSKNNATIRYVLFSHQKTRANPKMKPEREQSNRSC